jgi:hypothetical protein
MCESECTSFFNLPCFLIFRCTDKIRNFCLAIVLPIVVIIVVVIGCNTGLLTFPCCCRAAMLLTGITCILYLIKRKVREGETPQEEKQKEIVADNPEECPQTEK